ncbi:MAG: CPBP family intramembrane metalloprotease [Salinibacterium sp.]|nr:CPBP family intramembrane metalloprotease [Salinibacterium sp.]
MSINAMTINTTAPDAAAPGLPQRQYHHSLYAGGRQWWRGLATILVFVIAFLIASLALSGIAIAFDVLTGTATLEDLGAGILAITPAVFLANNLALAACIPIAMLLQWAFFGVRPRFLSSVEGGLRWKLLGRFALVVVPVWLVYVVVLFAIEPPLAGAEGITASAIALTVIVLVTTPLQAAGEEYGFRGLVARSVGSWFARPMVALVAGAIVSSIFFSIAHLAADPWLNMYYFAFGITMSILAWRTGGLEAAILIHATNNMFLLLPTVLFGDVGSIFERGEGTGGPAILLPMAMLVIMTVLLSWWAKRLGAVREIVPPSVRGTAPLLPGTPPAAPDTAPAAAHAELPN